MFWFFALVVQLGLALATTSVASKKNFQPSLWFLLGMMGGLLALIVVAVMEPAGRRY